MTIKAQIAVCPICDNAIKIAATDTTFERSITREFAKLMEMGYIIRSVTIEEARASKMFCEHKPPFCNNKITSNHE